MKWKFYLILLYIRSLHGFLIPSGLRLKLVRKTIDVIDDKIHDLICARLQCAEQLKGTKPNIRDPIREVTIIARLQDKDQLDPVMIKNIWRTLFEESYRVQRTDDKIENLENKDRYKD